MCSSDLGFVKSYYSLVEKLSTLAGKRMPAFGVWCDAERATCARYAAVQIDMRLQMNYEMAASYRA